MSDINENEDDFSVEAEIARNDSLLPKDAGVLLEAVLAHRGWDKRVGQFQVTEGISSAVNSGYPGIEVDVSASAPVGTGKSLAYILAALAGGKRVVVSTSTKSLQDQLINEELPQLKIDLKEIYGYDLTFGMLKGKSNYPCLASTRAMLNSGDKEDLMLFDDIETPDTRDVETLKEIIKRAEEAQKTRDTVAFDAEALMAKLRPATRAQISGSKNCAIQREKWIDPNKMKNMSDMGDDFSPSEIPQEYLDEFKELPAKVACTSRCIYRAAYAHAMDSQVVVVNTTLLAYELIKTDSIIAADSLSPYLLKGIGMVVVDEAHHLFRILAEAFSVELNVAKAIELVEDTAKKLTKRYGSDKAYIFDGFKDDFIESERELNYVVDGDTAGENAFRKLISDILQKIADRSEQFVADLMAFAAASERTSKTGLALDRNGVPKVVAAMGAQISEDIIGTARKLSEQMGQVDMQGRHQFDLSFSDAGRPFFIKTVPIDVSFFRKMVSRTSSMLNIYTGDTGLSLPAALVLSSGTISKQTPITVGMTTKNYLEVESPFDPDRVRVFVPRGLGKAQGFGDKTWVPKAWKFVEPSIRILGGRTKILTTSHDKCTQFTEIAREKLPKDIKVFSQSDNMGKAELIRLFKEAPNAVLVGTTSFWEGVDIPGDDLNLVVIEKLPFPQPNDPIFKARSAFVEERGGNAFMEVNVDYASIMLAQGTGRLIRAVNDIGGIIVLDDRMVTTRYAAKIVALLPKGWKITSSQPAFENWMDDIKEENRAKDGWKIPVADPKLWEPIGGAAALPRRKRLSSS